VNEVVVPSPAKVNLFLEVLGRRPDGYHEIESVLQLIDLCDEVRLRSGPSGIRLRVTGADLPEGEGNLAYRAAALLLGESRHGGGLEIHLAKRIPLAAGLGGGSSNAAAVLVGVNRLYGLEWSLAALQQLGARLGSDVPFFLTDGLALATGRGELLRPLTPWSPQWLVVANPGVPVSTAWVYDQVSSKLTKDEGRSNIRLLINDGRLPWPPEWAFNRLEVIVFPSRPEVKALRDVLVEGGGSPVLMSGSGGSVFAVMPDALSAAGLAARVRAGGAFAAAVRTLAANPLLVRGD
jgi:4-diphosphocytidyl-2-C-methyl-D-erythritol kinase